MKKSIQKQISETQQLNKVYLPEFFKLSIPADKKKLNDLLNQKPFISIFDELQGQLSELIKSKNPKKKYTSDEIEIAIGEHLKDTPWEEYGIWIYYPWSFRLIHILDQEEFIFVRTNRNQYKITPEEREILSRKKIGIIGLSIGQSIAMTMIMERVLQEIRLADFDILELSNLNRIRTNLSNLGLLKVIAVAREIAEIDPFIKVVCYTSGLNESNMDDFFLKDGKLDLLVEACDGLDIKIKSRQKAKSFLIPVIMDTNDKGMIDIERFDLEPNRPILHGLIDHLDASKLTGLTNEEKIPFLLPMIGIDTMSDRLKASMLEIEQSITTWPQLASAVAMGGGVVTDICRRILLNDLQISGRFFIDIDELIKDKDKPGIQEKPLNIRPSLTAKDMMQMVNLNKYIALPNQLDLPDQIIKEIITAAGMAPSGANIQPWRWMYHEKNLYLFFDDVYSAGLLDCGNTISFASLGAATENLVLKTHQLNIEVAIETPTLEKNTKLVSLFRFFDKEYAKSLSFIEPHPCDDLAANIKDRETNRNIRKRQHIEKNKLLTLKAAARTIPGADLIIIDDEKIMAELGEITSKMDRIRVMHEGGHRDFRAEIRWTPDEAKQAGNGVDLLGTVDLTASELAGWRIAKNWSVIKLLNDWKTGSGLEKIQRKSVNGSSALGLLTMPNFSCNDFFNGGRALERVWLKATQENICVHPASLSTLIFNTLIYGEKNSLPKEMEKEATQLRNEFIKLFSIDSSLGQVLLFRFFIADPPKAKSVRYPVEKILFWGRELRNQQ